MPESLLTILKLCALALLYLFFFRVIRAVWAEVSVPQAATPIPAGGPAPRRAPVLRDRRERRSSHLTVVEPEGMKGRTYDLAEELTVGRAAGCQVTLDDNYVSQLHARIFLRDGMLFVEDLGSTNGTYLNTRRVSAPVAIKRGDRLKVGSTVMELAP